MHSCGEMQSGDCSDNLVTDGAGLADQLAVLKCGISARQDRRRD